MLTYLFLKPESLHGILGIQKIIASKIDSVESEQERQFVKSVVSGIDILTVGKTRDIPRELVSVHTGILEIGTFRNIYPSLPHGWENYQDVLVGQPYGFIFIDIPNVEPGRETQVIHTLHEIKGRFKTDEHPEGTGLRRELRIIYERMNKDPDCVPLANYENFIHIPDSSREAEKLFDEIDITQKNGSSMILYDREISINKERERW